MASGCRCTAATSTSRRARSAWSPIWRSSLGRSAATRPQEPYGSTPTRHALTRIFAPRSGASGAKRRDLLAADNGTLALAPEALVDIRTIVARARALFTDSAADEVDLTLFSGELLPDWFDDWVLAERERVRQVCLHGLDRLAAVFLARKEYPQAIDAALLAIRVDPLRELSQRLLLEIHLAEGNLSEAIREFERYKALLWDELQIEPSRNLRELVAVTVR